jgi:hypothetical protein
MITIGRTRWAESDVEWAKQEWQNSVPAKEICAELRMARATLYKIAKRHAFGPHPLGEQTRTYQPRATLTKVEISPDCGYTCPHCAFRCTEREGHTTCIAEAA